MADTDIGQGFPNVAPVAGRMVIKYERGNVIVQPLDSAGVLAPDWARQSKYGPVIFFHVPLTVGGAGGRGFRGVRKHVKVVGG